MDQPPSPRVPKLRDQALELRIAVQISHGRVKDCMRHFGESRAEFMNALLKVLGDIANRGQLKELDERLRADEESLEVAVEDLRSLHVRLNTLDHDLYREEGRRLGIDDDQLTRYVDDGQLVASTIDTTALGSSTSSNERVLPKPLAEYFDVLGEITVLTERLEYDLPAEYNERALETERLIDQDFAVPHTVPDNIERLAASYKQDEQKVLSELEALKARATKLHAACLTAGLNTDPSMWARESDNGSTVQRENEQVTEWLGNVETGEGSRADERAENLEDPVSREQAERVYLDGLYTYETEQKYDDRKPSVAHGTLNPETGSWLTTELALPAAVEPLGNTTEPQSENESPSQQKSPRSIKAFDVEPRIDIQAPSVGSEGHSRDGFYHSAFKIEIPDGSLQSKELPTIVADVKPLLSLPLESLKAQPHVNMNSYPLSSPINSDIASRSRSLTPDIEEHLSSYSEKPSEFTSMTELTRSGLNTGSPGSGWARPASPFSRSSHVTRQLARNNELGRRSADFFEPGVVFETMWSDPFGQQHLELDVSPAHERGEAHPQFPQMRIFVAIEQRTGHCAALPIHTYNGKGVENKKKSEHAIVYTGLAAPSAESTEIPKPNTTEEPMKSRPIRVNPTNPENSLNIRSRINLGKVWPVPYSVQVMDFGKVAPECLEDLHNQYVQVTQAIGEKAEKLKQRKKSKTLHNERQRSL